LTTGAYLYKFVKIKMELNNWRLLDMGRRNASYNMALDEVLLEVRSKNISPNTIRFLQFSPPAALLGYHQSLKQEIRVDFCKESGIDIQEDNRWWCTFF